MEVVPVMMSLQGHSLAFLTRLLHKRRFVTREMEIFSGDAGPWLCRLWSAQKLDLPSKLKK